MAGVAQLSDNRLKSQLTSRERDISRMNLLDLAVGYPDVPAPAWLRHIWQDLSLGDLADAFGKRHPQAGPPGRLPTSVVLERLFVEAALRFLSLPPTLAANAFPTFSGSVALERALAIATRANGLVRLPAPIFDVIPGLLREREVDLDWWTLTHSAPQWTRATQGLRNHAATVVVSPDNPSGAVVSGAVLRRLAEEATAAETVLVVDQSFAMLSADGVPAPLLPAIAERSQRWIMVWDSGKTFDLGDEKIGLAIVSDDLRDRATDAFGLAQATLPRRLTMLMTLVLEEAGENDYITWLTSIRQATAAVVTEFGGQLGAVVDVPHWGGFATIDIPDLDLDVVVAEAERAGLGLVTTAAFAAGTPLEGQRPRLRVPLTRDVATVRAALELLTAVVGRLRDGR